MQIRQSVINLALGVFIVSGGSLLHAAGKPAVPNANDDEALARSTAVTLNYCRAAFHRIRSCPSKRVLLEEQERILNNLDLNRVADQEVVNLYAAVLHEIGQTNIATKDREVIRGRYKRLFRHKMVGNVVAMGSKVIDGEYLKALRIGAGSWWDYRSMVWDRGLDLWLVEKKQIANIQSKSALFLDTFWKLTRKRKIPDRWLIRSADLNRLDAALRQADPKVRLRVLLRMRPFMECYPPYWYYVARTQQQLGQLFAAAQTFVTLEKLGGGHFRKDDLLAAGTANRAAIQDYLRQPSAVQTARRALAYSPDAWEVNLLCAGVLYRHKKNDEAEDALLRNLDVELETEQTRAALLILYCDTANAKKLAEQLSDPKTLKTIPVPAVLRCLAFLHDQPATAVSRTMQHRLSRQLRGSLTIRFDRHFGPDDLYVSATPQWQLTTAKISIRVNGKRQRKYRLELDDGRHEARFRGVVDVGSLVNPQPFAGPLVVDLAYPHGRTVSVMFERPRTVANGPRAIRAAVNSPYQISTIVSGNTRVLANGRTETIKVQPKLHKDRTAKPPARPSLAAPSPAKKNGVTTGPPRTLPTDRPAVPTRKSPLRVDPTLSGPDLLAPPPKRKRRAKPTE